MRSHDITIPTTAEDYLVLVRRAADALPDVFVSEVAPEPKPPRTRSTLSAVRLAPMPAFARPCATWTREVLESFKSLQQGAIGAKGDPTNRPANATAWRECIFGTQTATMPSAHMLAGLDYVDIACAFSVFDDNLPIANNPDDGVTILSELMLRRRDKWLFALLANLQLYVHA